MSAGVPFWTTIYLIPVFLSIPFEKLSKRCNFIASQNSEISVPVWTGVQVRVIATGHFWSSNLIRFGGAFGGVMARGGHQRETKDHLDAVPKKSFANRGTGSGGPGWGMEAEI